MVKETITVPIINQVERTCTIFSHVTTIGIIRLEARLTMRAYNFRKDQRIHQPRMNITYIVVFPGVHNERRKYYTSPYSSAGLYKALRQYNVFLAKFKINE